MTTTLVSYKDYVAGWLDSSIGAFLHVVPPDADSMRYALVTCIDSNVTPKTMLEESPELRSLQGAQPLGNGLLVPTRLLLQAHSRNQLFFGFDEIWFFPSAAISPKRASVWLVGPARINPTTLKKVGEWMVRNSCSLALGDGAGLNCIVKARGLVKYLLGHSLCQGQPEDGQVPTAEAG
jgi:hypothetical protein